MPQLAVAIVVVVLLNGAFAFVQEYRADQAGRRLRELIPADVTVRRDSRRTVVGATELVAGDVVLLEAGDRISADLELAEVHALAVNESTLTGESTPARTRETDTVFTQAATRPPDSGYALNQPVKGSPRGHNACGLNVVLGGQDSLNAPA